MCKSVVSVLEEREESLRLTFAEAYTSRCRPFQTGQHSQTAGASASVCRRAGFFRRLLKRFSKARGARRSESLRPIIDSAGYTYP
jgi:hypothetical protein